MGRTAIPTLVPAAAAAAVRACRQLARSDWTERAAPAWDAWWILSVSLVSFQFNKKEEMSVEQQQEEEDQEEEETRAGGER